MNPGAIILWTDAIAQSYWCPTVLETQEFGLLVGCIFDRRSWSKMAQVFEWLCFALSYREWVFNSIVYIAQWSGPWRGDGCVIFLVGWVMKWAWHSHLSRDDLPLCKALWCVPQKACPYHLCCFKWESSKFLRIIVHMCVCIYIYIHPLSPDWSWHFFGASNDLPSHNSDTRLSQGEFLHRNSYPKPFQNPSGRESATEGVKLSKEKFPFFLRLALNSYMDRGKSCSKYKGSIREGSKAKCVVCCSRGTYRDLVSNILANIHPDKV